MSEALDKMVAAMVAEVKRQAEVGSPGPWVYGEEAPNIQIDGWVDMKLVARAGLEAIREPGGEIVAAGAAQGGMIELRGYDYPLGEIIDTDNIWAGMIDAILKEPEA